jgi:hypothetical protein
MEVSTTPNLYQYSSIPQDGYLNFRVFTLYPAHEFSAAIRGELHLSSPSCRGLENYVWEQFEALSYAWGDDTPTEVIEFLDKSYLPIATNLESFLRYRRKREEPVALWVDAICINQQDLEEKSKQVQVMGQIYLLSSRLCIWLGCPSDDSSLAMSALREISNDSPFSKLSISQEASAAIECLMNHSWWSRAWIIQEIALGGLGRKYNAMTLRCGFEDMKWCHLVLACSRIYVNTINMHQSFPAVGNALKKDALPSRCKNEFWGSGESYAYRLLRQLSEHRDCLASDGRDKIYALLGLWVPVDAVSAGSQIARSQRAAPTVNYSRSVEDVYVNFATWIISETQSLDLLHHCQPYILDSPIAEPLPTWVPDWSRALPQARLPCTKARELGSIPWWSFPIPVGAENERRFSYRMQDQSFYKKCAEEVLRPIKSTLHYVPEWFVDSIDPDGKDDIQALFKELQGRLDFFFVFPDECDRALGNDTEDMWTSIKRTQDHNERQLQKQVLSQYFESSSLLRAHYRASADTTCKPGVTGRKMHIEGILFDTVREIFDPFPEDIKRDWKESTLLMVQIGKCKQTAMNEAIEKSPFLNETSRLTAFWRTLFAGQQASDETDIASWLPLVPQGGWEWKTPSLTVLQSARLEMAEIRTFIDAYFEQVASETPSKHTFEHAGFDEHLTKDDSLLDVRWNSSDRLEYACIFGELGEEWLKQPYDLYHRPFNLPYVVPDPFWESRCLHDEAALKASMQSRHRSTIESINGESHELRSDIRRFLREKIRQRPAREPPTTNDASLIQYALGRRFFISEEGNFGLAPPNARKGDHIAVFYGAETPFILRKGGSTYQVVGESYVHGLMNGEAINSWRLGTKEVRNIVLI